MYYIKYRGEILGPYGFDEALSICGSLNFLREGSATLIDSHGDYIQ